MGLKPPSKPSVLRADLEALTNEWNRMGLVEQDRHGAEYAIRAILLAERIMDAADTYRDMAFDRFDQSQ